MTTSLTKQIFGILFLKIQETILSNKLLQIINYPTQTVYSKLSIQTTSNKQIRSEKWREFEQNQEATISTKSMNVSRPHDHSNDDVIVADDNGDDWRLFFVLFFKHYHVRQQEETLPWKSQGGRKRKVQLLIFCWWTESPSSSLFLPRHTSPLSFCRNVSLQTDPLSEYQSDLDWVQLLPFQLSLTSSLLQCLSLSRWVCVNVCVCLRASLI